MLLFEQCVYPSVPFVECSKLKMEHDGCLEIHVLLQVFLLGI